jgi:hypothetical protein
MKPEPTPLPWRISTGGQQRLGDGSGRLLARGGGQRRSGPGRRSGCRRRPARCCCGRALADRSRRRAGRPASTPASQRGGRRRRARRRRGGACPSRDGREPPPPRPHRAGRGRPGCQAMGWGQDRPTGAAGGWEPVLSASEPVSWVVGAASLPDAGSGGPARPWAGSSWGPVSGVEGWDRRDRPRGGRLGLGGVRACRVWQDEGDWPQDGGQVSSARVARCCLVAWGLLGVGCGSGARWLRRREWTSCLLRVERGKPCCRQRLGDRR